MNEDIKAMNIQEQIAKIETKIMLEYGSDALLSVQHRGSVERLSDEEYLDRIRFLYFG